MDGTLGAAPTLHSVPEFQALRFAPAFEEIAGSLTEKTAYAGGNEGWHWQVKH
jgi:hypothetical protein